MLNTSEQFVADQVGEDWEPVDEACHQLFHYMHKAYSYNSKNERLSKWRDTEPNLYEIVISVFTTVLLHPALSLPAICGMLNYQIKLEKELDRVKTIAEILAVISKTGLIHIIQRPGDMSMVKSGYSLDIEIPVDDKHILNKYKAQEVVYNYDDVQGSMLLGGALNHHDDEICLDHINRMNKIPLKLNIDLLKQYPEEPTYELDTPEKVEQWQQHKTDSILKYLEVIRNQGNKFYLDHKYDTRGRCYAVGYYINTQGTSFKKAITELYYEELVEDIIL